MTATTARSFTTIARSSIVFLAIIAMAATALIQSNEAEAIAPGVDVVFIADGRNYADALVGSTLAAAHGTSVLTVAGTNAGDYLPDATRAELVRLQPKRIVILGGEAAVSQAVAAELAQLSNPAGNVERIAGDDRFDTAARISQVIPGGGNANELGAVNYAERAGVADMLDGLDSTDFVRSEQTCGVGQVISGFSADGAVRCTANVVELDVPQSLPAGATLTGGYVLDTHTPGSTLGDPVDYATAVTLPFPLAVPAVSHFVADGAVAPAACTGSAANPTAAPGHLCIYESAGDGYASVDLGGFGYFGSATPGLVSQGASLLFTDDLEGGDLYSIGRWAVTAATVSPASSSAAPSVAAPNGAAKLGR